MTPETIIIQSDSGENVTYTIHPHGAAEGFDLAPRILALMSGPAAMAAALAAASAGAPPAPVEDADGEAGSRLAGEVEGMFSGVDGAALSTAIKDFGSTIVAQGGHRLCLTILKYTSAAPESGAPVKLDNVASFNSRYAANYGELFTAIYHVVRVNWGPMIARMMKGRDPLDALGALVAKGTRR